LKPVFDWIRDRKLQFFILAGVLVLGLLAFLARGWIGERGAAVFGVLCFFGLCFSLSHNPLGVKLRTLGTGILLQVGLALLVLKTAFGQAVFGVIGDGIRKFLEFTDQGSEFVFGVLANPEAMDGAFGAAKGFVFAFRALPTIIFVAAFFAVLYHFGILQLLVRGMARVMMWAMRVSGAESLSGAANIFMGQTEAPLIIKPYVAGLTRSELLAVMIGGFATIAAGIMAVYIGMGAGAEALLAASVMSAPASLVVAKILIPETETPQTTGRAEVVSEKNANMIDALSHGAQDGLRLALNVGAMLIAFLAAIAMIDFILGYADLSLSQLFGWIFAPFAFLCGAPVEEVPALADLLGTKLVANEFVAYVNLTGEYLPQMSLRTATIATVALCGFANFGSVGIQIGGIGGIAPERRSDLSRLGMLALFGGFMVTLINAAVVGVILSV
jgi:CNT family concentrative nucleoside transporter